MDLIVTVPDEKSASFKRLLRELNILRRVAKISWPKYQKVIAKFERTGQIVYSVRQLYDIVELVPEFTI